MHDDGILCASTVAAFTFDTVSARMDLRTMCVCVCVCNKVNVTSDYDYTVNIKAESM